MSMKSFQKNFLISLPHLQRQRSVCDYINFVSKQILNFNQNLCFHLTIKIPWVKTNRKFARCSKGKWNDKKCYRHGPINPINDQLSSLFIINRVLRNFTAKICENYLNSAILWNKVIVCLINLPFGPVRFYHQPKCRWNTKIEKSILINKLIWIIIKIQ